MISIFVSEFAEACFAKGFKDKAVDILIGIITKDNAWEDGKARLQLLKYFEVWDLPIQPVWQVVANCPVSFFLIQFFYIFCYEQEPFRPHLF